MASLSPVSGALGRRNAAHLLRRATFGPRQQDIDRFAGLSADQALTELFQPLTAPPAPPPFPLNDEGNIDEGAVAENFKAWFIELMRTAGNTLTEKVVFFLHTHFTAIESKIDNGRALYYQNTLFRYYALGDIRELARKICTDNAMLRLLDGDLNEAGSPNENFAREFFELYTIGKGPQVSGVDYTNYTEDDIKEAAKVFSGFKFDDKFANPEPLTRIPTGRYQPDQHDVTTKQFTARFQNATVAPTALTGRTAPEATALDEVAQLVKIIFDQPETARFLCRKLYRFFVYWNITEEVERDIIGPLASTMRTGNYQLQPVLAQLFRSQHFFDLDTPTEMDNHRGAIIKSPLDLVLGMVRYFEVAFPAATDAQVFYQDTYGSLLRKMDDQGMIFYEPFDVAGYDAYHQRPGYHRNWISPNYLANRYLFATELMKGFGENSERKTPPSVKLDPVAFVRLRIANPEDPNQIVQTFVDNLLPEVIKPERFDYFLKDLLLDNLSVMNWQMEWRAYVNTGEDAGVRKQLESLLNAILQSPEYQLM